MPTLRRPTRLVLACVLSAAVAAPASAAATVTPTPALNTAPTAQPDSAQVGSGQTVTIAVLDNDSDLDGDDLSLTAVTAAAHGQTVVDANSVSYTAAVDFVGSDSFDYTVSDPSQATSTGTVTIDVTAPPATYANTLGAPGTVVALRSASISGTATPGASAPPKVVLQRLGGAGWTSVRTAVATGTGAYAFTYAPTAAATIQWRTVATWPGGTVRTSATRSMTVVARLDALVSGPLARADVPYSYRAGCPVSPQGLRRVTMTYYNYKGKLKRGKLIVSAGSVQPLLNVFRSGFRARFPLKKLHPTDYYYAKGKRSPSGSDVAAMRAGNTSAFNCRPVTGNPYRRSQHSYGNAIDINTFENPYVTGSRVYPSKARSFLNRSRYRTGMILRKRAIAKAMRRNGWPWGARWAHPDYQHFSSNGG